MRKEDSDIEVFEIQEDQNLEKNTNIIPMKNKYYNNNKKGHKDEKKAKDSTTNLNNHNIDKNDNDTK